MDWNRVTRELEILAGEMVNTYGENPENDPRQDALYAVGWGLLILSRALAEGLSEEGTALPTEGELR